MYLSCKVFWPANASGKPMTQDHTVLAQISKLAVPRVPLNCARVFTPKLLSNNTHALSTVFAAYRLKDRKALSKGGQVILQKLLYRCQLSLQKFLSL